MKKKSDEGLAIRVEKRGDSSIIGEGSKNNDFDAFNATRGTVGNKEDGGPNAYEGEEVTITMA